MGDGIWAGIAEARYKVNSNAAVIETNDGLVVVDFRGHLSDLIAAVKKASAAGAALDEMKTKVADQLAGKYEKGMSKYPLGRYRDRIAQNIEVVYAKVVKAATRWMLSKPLFPRRLRSDEEDASAPA